MCWDGEGMGGHVTWNRQGAVESGRTAGEEAGSGGGDEERKDKNNFCLRKDPTLKPNYFKLILTKEKKRKSLLAHFFSKSNKIHSFK